jgi:hypothetical protein
LQQANPTVSTSNESLVIAMRTHVHRDDGGAVITIAGTFDTTDVDELGMVARSLYPTGTVVLDFHEVEVLSDCAIAKLASELQQQEWPRRAGGDVGAPPPAVAVRRGQRRPRPQLSPSGA